LPPPAALTCWIRSARRRRKHRTDVGNPCWCGTRGKSRPRDLPQHRARKEVVNSCELSQTFGGGEQYRHVEPPQPAGRSGQGFEPGPSQGKQQKSLPGRRRVRPPYREEKRMRTTWALRVVLFALLCAIAAGAAMVHRATASSSASAAAAAPTSQVAGTVSTKVVVTRFRAIGRKVVICVSRNGTPAKPR
jgi:hypothetical protein